MRDVWSVLVRMSPGGWTIRKGLRGSPDRHQVLPRWIPREILDAQPMPRRRPLGLPRLLHLRTRLAAIHDGAPPLEPSVPRIRHHVHLALPLADRRAKTPQRAEEADTAGVHLPEPMLCEPDARLRFRRPDDHRVIGRRTQQAWRTRADGSGRPPNGGDPSFMPYQERLEGYPPGAVCEIHHLRFRAQLRGGTGRCARGIARHAAFERIEHGVVELFGTIGGSGGGGGDGGGSRVRRRCGDARDSPETNVPVLTRTREHQVLCPRFACGVVGVGGRGRGSGKQRPIQPADPILVPLEREPAREALAGSGIQRIYRDLAFRRGERHDDR